MAPPEKTFPITQLEDRVHLHDVNYNEKSRKLPRDFDLTRDCELFELVQYSCTTQEEINERNLQGLAKPRNTTRGHLECYPFVRLFRKCKYGNQDFTVETTAWEGRHKWKPSKRQVEEAEERATAKTREAKYEETKGVFATYGSYFWGK